MPLVAAAPPEVSEPGWGLVAVIALFVGALLYDGIFRAPARKRAHELKFQEELKRRAQDAADSRAAEERLRREREEKEAAHRARLVAAYGEAGAEHVQKRELWQGAPRAAVEEMFGPPVAVDEKVLKQSTKHTLKYRQQGKGKFGLRVMLEDGIVVGWEEKDT